MHIFFIHSYVEGYLGHFQFGLFNKHCEQVSPVAQIIKTQRQILGFNLEIRKAKQPSHWRALTSKKASDLKRISSCLILVYIPL